MKSIKLPFSIKRPILACGADLKGAFAFARGNEAFLADGFGDLGDLDNFTKYEKAIKAYQKKRGIIPRIVICDLHPDYYSTRFSKSFAQYAIHHTPYAVQHHEAHIASAIIDNNIRGDVIGVAFDGTGYGPDGNIWGGEFFAGNLKNFKRAAHLKYIPMPGGEAAIKAPWRMAVSYLYKIFGNRLPALAKRWNKKDLAVLKTMIDKNINCPLTSSVGRLLDAAGSLIMGKDFISKEAELPIELERIVSSGACGKYESSIRKSGESYIIDTAGIIKGIVGDIVKGEGKPVMSCKLHNTIADIILKTSLAISKKFKTKQVVLSGGVFQNKYLTSRATEILEDAGLKVYTHLSIATNDSGLPIGQIAIAQARLQCV